MNAPDENAAARLRRVDALPGSAPNLHPEIQGFWDSLADGVLSVQRCSGCQALRFPISTHCHHCLDGEFSWSPIDPHGVVDVAIEVHRAVAEQAPSGLSLLDPWRGVAPYKTGVVDMADGVRLPGRILCECNGALRPGAEVVAVLIDAANDMTVYAFAHGCTELGAES